MAGFCPTGVLNMEPSAAELARWAALARRHWREFQPRRYRRLQRAGHLERELAAAARLTADAMADWVGQGATWDEAWEATRALYLFPTEEAPKSAERIPDSAAFSAIIEFNRRLQEDDET